MENTNLLNKFGALVFLVALSACSSATTVEGEDWEELPTETGGDSPGGSDASGGEVSVGGRTNGTGGNTVTGGTETGGSGGVLDDKYTYHREGSLKKWNIQGLNSCIIIDSESYYEYEESGVTGEYDAGFPLTYKEYVDWCKMTQGNTATRGAMYCHDSSQPNGDYPTEHGNVGNNEEAYCFRPSDGGVWCCTRN